VPISTFTLDAVITHEHWKHHRLRDHFGADSDLYIMLSERVGKYEAFTPIHHVLADMVARLGWLEDYSRTRSSFTLDAVISSQVIPLDAVVKRTMSGSFTLDARLIHTGSFTLDAHLVGRFTLDAFIV
jgi:hypothetical protein